MVCACFLTLILSTPAADLPPLRETLAEIDKIAQLYGSEALSFTSDETVVLKSGGRTQTHRFRHIYTIDPFGKHTELREPLKRRHDPAAPANTNPYLWIFLFESGRRAYMHFEWVGIETRLEREALGIAFRPRGEIFPQVNDWYGVAWFDRETFRPLVFEAWVPREYERKLELDRRLAEAAAAAEPSRSEHVITSFRTEFGEERNGLRLPTRVTMREQRFTVWGKDGSSGYRERTLSSVKQLYTNYRFYSVDTDQTIGGVTVDQGSRNN
ncbi:MAG: hypothetical protein GTO30_11890 [Acidobacteria bacterium]|nr:hypothetical protein [Acidobacteriota bacterium]NIM62328.1 hypothetical protein [Acidobacteriota bacterium]NIO60661.1 hypothetical protein [Acidobacteriota bacterium]NIQ85094.1 hypothetical protein [Acidobacteriota bacterium]NIT12305.1 hypothetical protein [Acidobacteriota bacterium]